MSGTCATHLSMQLGQHHFWIMLSWVGAWAKAVLAIYKTTCLNQQVKWQSLQLRAPPCGAHADHESAQYGVLPAGAGRGSGLHPPASRGARILTESAAA